MTQEEIRRQPKERKWSFIGKDGILAMYRHIREDIISICTTIVKVEVKVKIK